MVGWLMMASAAARVGVGAVGSVGLPVGIPSLNPQDGAGMLCGGVDVALLLNEDEPREKNPKRYHPNHSRLVLAGMSCGQGSGRSAFAGGVGPGAQWGSRKTYTTAHMVLGVSSLRAESGALLYEEVGFWLRPRISVGAQLSSGLAVEIGPSIQAFLPLVTRSVGVPPSGEVKAIIGIDMTVLLGSAGPKPW